MAHLLDDLRVRFTLSQGMFCAFPLSNIVTVIDFMELLGVEVKGLMKQLLEGVEYIHKHDIIHRYTFSEAQESSCYKILIHSAAILRCPICYTRTMVY